MRQTAEKHPPGLQGRPDLVYGHISLTPEHLSSRNVWIPKSTHSPLPVGKKSITDRMMEHRECRLLFHKHCHWWKSISPSCVISQCYPSLHIRNIHAITNQTPKSLPVLKMKYFILLQKDRQLGQFHHVCALPCVPVQHRCWWHFCLCWESWTEKTAKACVGLCPLCFV